MMSRENVLKHLALIGKSLAHDADPGIYPYEYRYRANYYKKPLNVARTAYKNIKSGHDIVTELKKLKGVVKGIEANKVQLLLIANTTGFKPTDSWEVVDGDLVHRRSKEANVVTYKGAHYIRMIRNA